MNSQPLSEETIFGTARLIENTEARQNYLDQVCAGNQALRERVEALIEADAHDFLNTEPAATEAAATITESPGQQIGPYKLMEQIGEGGMGVVFVAQQDQPIRRKVALKIIKPGMDSKEVIARFEAERQALALMDHPNIATVLDAGGTETGRPYFVMELVRGVPITEYCDLNKFSARQRLQLFVHVCNAVQHAHQKGVIHRDLKPSNVLVTEHDGTPVAKVIDFGVAKATNQQLTERTIYTRHQQLVGTPMYMSPEQAELSALDVDTRSDIYSLGVLLYELLTGTTPFDKQRFNKAAYDEIRRIIREEEPSKPSTKIRSLGQTAATISGYRGTDPGKLSQALRGDLDWIVMKSLEKDRNRRYDTANGLANDIERHLRDEAILARPPSQIYQFRKFARRHKALLTSTALVAVSLIVGIGVATRMAIVAHKAEQKQRLLAENARRSADSERLARAHEAEAREETRRELYRAEMGNALRDWGEGNVDRVIELLRRSRPGTGQQDLRGFEWYYLWQQCQPALQTPALEHGHPVHAVAYSPTQNKLATGGSKWVTLWDLHTRRQEHVFDSAERWTFDIAFSPDGRQLAAANQDNNVKVWDVDSKSELYMLPHDEPVWSLEYSPDGRLLASGSGYGGVTLWNPTTGKLADRLAPSTGGGWRATSLVFSGDSRLLAVGLRGPEGSVTVWDLHTKERLGVLNNVSVPALDFAPDGNTVAMSWFDKRLIFWDWRSAEQRTVDNLAVEPLAIAYAPTGDVLAVNGPSHTVEIRDGSTGELGERISGHSLAIESAVFSPSGKELATGSFDSTVRLWDLTKSVPPTRISAHSSLVESLAFSPDGSFLMSGGNVGVKLWDTRTWQLQQTVDEQGRRYGATISPDGSWLAYQTHPQVDREVRILDLKTQQVRSFTSDVDPYTHAMTISPDSRYLAIAGGDNVKLYDVLGEEKPKVLEGHRGVVERLAFSPDGKLLASGSFDFTAKLWDVAKGQLLYSLEEHTQVVSALVFTLDGKSLISGSRDSTLRLWDVASGREKQVLSNNNGWVRGLALSPDGATLAVGADRSVLLWDLHEGKERARFLCQDEVCSVAFSPSGRTLVSGQWLGAINIWQAADPEEVRRAGW